MGLGGTGLLAAALAGALAGSILQVAVPKPITQAPPGPVLETVTPAQLAAMTLRLESTVQPVRLPDWVTPLGVRPPSTIVMRPEAEAAVRRTSTGVQSVLEVMLAYGTLATPAGGPRSRAPMIVHRLVWAVVGTRSLTGTVGGALQVLWLVDAHSGRQLTEMPVPAALPATGTTGAAGR
jgi:hypothetical protein